MRTSQQGHAGAVLLALLLGGGVSCAGSGDVANPTVGTPVREVSVARMQLQSERAALDLAATYRNRDGTESSGQVVKAGLVQVTRAFAIALKDSALRSYVYAAMKRSPYKEGKVSVSTLLHSSRSPFATVASAFARTGVSAADLRNLAERLPELELYMPVPGHRAAYEGGSDVLVATAIGGAEIPVAFDLDGQRVPLSSATVPPTTPTIAIVRAETRFNKEDMVSRTELVSFCDPETAIQPCDDPGQGPFIPPPPGLFLEYMVINNVDDTFDGGFLEGTPEIEVATIWRTAGSSSIAVIQQCSGEHAGDPGRGGPGVRSEYYAFDQQEDVWSGSVLLASDDQLAGIADTAIAFMIYEDDNNACEPRFSPPTINSFSPTVQGAPIYKTGFAGRSDCLGATFAGIEAEFCSPSPWEKVFNSIFNDSDDRIGMLVPMQSTNFSFSDANFALISTGGKTFPQSLIGRARIVRRE